jgi:hypothetical protein
MLSVIMLSVIMLSVIMLSVIMLSVIMLSIIMLSVIIMNVVMLIVVAPKGGYNCNKIQSLKGLLECLLIFNKSFKRCLHERSCGA